MSGYKDCTLIEVNDNPYCEFHRCGSEDYCQCKCPECPHCYSKSIYEYDEPDEKNPGDFFRKIRVIKNLGEEPHE